MYWFKTAVKLVESAIYTPSKLVITNLKEETQNSEYAAGSFTLSSEIIKARVDGSTYFSNTARFRVAKITPTKIGQFVTFWQKGSDGINQPYDYDEAPDLLIISVFKDYNVEGDSRREEIKINNSSFGQFVFPKAILLNKGILKSSSAQGKMGMRVYPSWDTPTSNSAIKTQQWQLNYFFAMSDISSLPIDKILALYG